MKSAKYLYIEGLILDSHLLELTLPELRKQDRYLSDFTKATKAERRIIQGSASSNTKFWTCELNPTDGSVLFSFTTEATEGKLQKEYDPKTGKMKTSHKIQVTTEPKFTVNPGTDTKVSNPSNTYDVYILVLDVLPTKRSQGLITKINPDKKPITNKLLKQLFEIADIKIHSQDPSFHFQGFQYWLDQAGGSIYPEGRKPQKWDKIHGNGKLLTKHLAQLMDALDFFLNQMASSLNNQLKKAGYFNKPTPPKKPSTPKKATDTKAEPKKDNKPVTKDDLDKDQEKDVNSEVDKTSPEENEEEKTNEHQDEDQKAQTDGEATSEDESQEDETSEESLQEPKAKGKEIRNKDKDV